MGKHLLKLYAVFMFGILCALFSYILSRNNHFTTQELAHSAQIQLQQKETIAQSHLEKLSASLKIAQPKELFNQYKETMSDFLNHEELTFYIYKRDSLCFWTDNQPAIDFYAYKNKAKAQLIKTRNGWYECIQEKPSVTSPYTIVALISIKPEYDVENQYLNNHFGAWLDLPENTKLLTPVSFLSHAVNSKFGIPLFEIYRSDGLYNNPTVNMYSSILFLVAILLWLISLLMVLKRYVRDRSKFIAVFIVIGLVIRSVMIYFKWPGVFYETSFYDAKLFGDAASFYFSYLGDVLINTACIFLLSVLIFKAPHSKTTYHLSLNWLLSLLSLVILSFFSFQIRWLIGSLVNNSTISYNINELFSFNTYSLIGLLSVGFLLFSFYLCLDRFVQFLARIHVFTKFGLLSCSILIIALITYCLMKQLPLVDNLWPLLFFCISVYIHQTKSRYHFINIGVIVFVATYAASSLFNHNEQINKVQTFEAISYSLADRQDVIAENEFNKISSSIKRDVQLKQLLNLLPLSTEQIEQTIRQQNFSDYFERYDIVMSLFKNDCTPVFLQLNPIYLNEDYFKQQIERGGSKTISEDLYFIEKEKKSARYIAKLKIDDLSKDPTKTFHLYIQLEPKLAVNLGAFPDLLLDKSLENKFESKQISYAVYESNRLLNTFGEYQYPLFVSRHGMKISTGDGYEHFFYQPKPNVIIIISDKEFGMWGQFTSVSYLFIFFSLLVLLSVSFNSIFITKNYSISSLNHRIQFILVSIVVLSLTAVVFGTIVVVNSQFELKNKKDLIIKSQSVLKELQPSVGQQQYLDPSFKEATSYKLKRLAQLFGSDISLFDKNGLLYATSQPAIYDQGLISKFMNPRAYISFKKVIRANYSQKENIGTLNYLSAYIPFYSKNDQLIGYINLPYFSRQKDLEKELTAYLTTLINIYTILFVITTLIALLVSNLLTKPLRIIKQQISNIQFGKFNESLQWKSNDEIGNLVAEYNAMLIKLEKSSELLAHSERESAWREMAKQVAHEIKNPLTPMKLNIQHLKRVVESHPDDINERVNRVSEMLIEQIDSLSHIATEFSNFAKLPNPNLEPVNLADVLRSIADLFQQNTRCHLSLQSPDELWILADKEQCLRIFTNLLKNAEQSIPESRIGNIEVFAFVLEDSVTVKVKDNGCGIPEEIKPKLFTPNFTTKSTGTGLGLAMVKSAIVSFNGSINFETELNKGTMFTIVLPLLKM